MDWRSHAWVEVPVPMDAVRWGWSECERIDQITGGTWKSNNPGARWIGFVAERFVYRWLQDNGGRVMWERESPITKADLYLPDGRSIDVKAAIRDKFRPHYAVSMTESTHLVPTEILFCIFQPSRQSMTIVGGVAYQRLLRECERHEGGRPVNGGNIVNGAVPVDGTFSVNTRKALLRIDAPKLDTPGRWFSRVFEDEDESGLSRRR